MWLASGCGLIGSIHRDRMRLLDRTACRTIRDIRAREFERPPAVVAAAGVELRGMVREGEQVSPKKLFEAETCGVELCLGLFESSLARSARRQDATGPPDRGSKALAQAAPPRRRFGLGSRRSPPSAHAPSHSPASKQSRVDTRAQQDSGPGRARVLPTACRAESRPTPAGTAKCRRTSKTPADRQRPPRRSARDRQARRREAPDLRADRSPWRFGDAQRAPHRAPRHRPDRSSTSGARWPRAVRPSARHARDGLVHRRSDALSKRPRLEQALRETSRPRVRIATASASRRSSASRSPRNCAARRSLSTTASATPGRRGSCAKRAHARRRALSRLIAAISPSVADGARTVKFHDRAHAAAAKRGFRLPRPVLTNVDTMVLTTMSG